MSAIQNHKAIQFSPYGYPSSEATYLQKRENHKAIQVQKRENHKAIQFKTIRLSKFRSNLSAEKGRF